MARLTAAQRAKMPKSEFGLPNTKGFPINDREHAILALGRATQGVDEGTLTPWAAEQIKARARGILKRNKKGKKG